MTPQRCTFCNSDDDVTVCCSEHPEARICGLCRKARQGSKYKHRVPDGKRMKPIPGALTPPFPCRFSGDALQARIDALRVTSAKATPCTECGQMMISSAGSTHVTCLTGEIPTRKSERVPLPDLVELAAQGLGGLAASAAWVRGLERALNEAELEENR